MTEKSQTDSSFSEDSTSDFQSYHAMSSLAVACLVVGLLSPIAIWGPPLWFVPVVGILLGARAWYRISKDPGLGGRKTAVFGIALALFFGSLGVADHLTYYWALERQAREVAATWFDFVTHDQVPLAHQLTLRPNERAGAGIDPMAMYRKKENREALQSWTETPTIERLQEWANQAHMEFLANEALYGLRGKEQLDLLFRVTKKPAKSPSETDERSSFQIRLGLRRAGLHRADQVDWFLASIKSDLEEASEPSSEKNAP